jgi:hypothetical protein
MVMFAPNRELLTVLGVGLGEARRRVLDASPGRAAPLP